MNTSHEAYESVAPIIPIIREQIYRWVAERGERGATCDEAERALGLSHQTCSARFTELRQANQLIDAGVKRKTRSGRNAVAYRTAEASVEVQRRLFA